MEVGPAYPWSKKASLHTQSRGAGETGLKRYREKVARLVVVGSHVVLEGFGGIQKFRIQN